jgi:uncharacterized protein
MTWRVVLDTNVYISALRYGGKPRLVLDAGQDGGFQLLISAPLKRELERVLRDKFGLTPNELAYITQTLWTNAAWIDPKIRLALCPDEPDNRVLECAFEGKANCIVTGDRHLLRLPAIDPLIILTPDHFLERLHKDRSRD